MKKFMMTLAVVAGLLGLTIGLGFIAEKSIPAAQACTPPNC